ncbi:family A G protein-coupled receptor-like protein [Neoconidiobolus thromboides FSU 785]|nr:family A G protein-coupled receptor-like protein [Neoconidiobolus thromboides FSU 785]
MVDAGEIFMLIQDLIGIIVNCAMFYIIVVKLKLKGIDLKLILVIGILDCLFFINSVLRISLITWFNQNLKLLPTWWCGWDSTLTLITLETSFELVAILSLMRYFTICTKYKPPILFWVLISLLSFSISVIAPSYAFKYNDPFSWSASKLICLPLPKPSAHNLDYAKFLYSFFMARFIFDILVIVFCYLNITLKYNKAISINFYDTTTVYQQRNLQIPYNDTIHDVQSIQSSDFKCDEHTNKQIRKIRTSTTIKLLTIVIAYIVCILPNSILSLKIALKPEPINSNLVTCTHILISFVGIINPLFVLLVHEPSRRQLIRLTPFIFPNNNKKIHKFPYFRHP